MLERTRRGIVKLYQRALIRTLLCPFPQTDGHPIVHRRSMSLFQAWQQKATISSYRLEDPVGQPVVAHELKKCSPRGSAWAPSAMHRHPPRQSWPGLRAWPGGCDNRHKRGSRTTKAPDATWDVDPSSMCHCMALVLQRGSDEARADVALGTDGARRYRPTSYVWCLAYAVNRLPRPRSRIRVELDIRPTRASSCHQFSMAVSAGWPVADIFGGSECREASSSTANSFCAMCQTDLPTSR